MQFANMWKAAAVAILSVLGLAAPAAATTYSITFYYSDDPQSDPFGDAIADGTGSFDYDGLVTGFNEPVSNLSATINGVTFDTIMPGKGDVTVFSDPYGIRLNGLVAKTGESQASNTGVLFFSTTSLVDNSYIGAFADDYVCEGDLGCGGQFRGTYVISEVAPVPLPAAGLLLTGALGGFAGLRRRRRA